jgi:hypothetical protein
LVVEILIRVTGNRPIMNVTICPPSEFGYGHGGNAPAFDNHAFAGRRTKAVSTATGLSFADFGKMHVKRTAKLRRRRMPTPEWSMSDNSLREVVVRYLEKRLFIRPSTCSYEQRLSAIEAKAKKQIPNLVSRLKFLQQLHSGATEESRLRRLQIVIQNIDSQIVLHRRGIAAVILSVAYLYHRMGYDSTTVSNETELKPPCVREILFRMNNMAIGKPYKAYGKRIPSRTRGRLILWTPKRLKLLFLMRTTGKTVAECAVAFRIRPDTIYNVWKNNFGGLNQKKRAFCQWSGQIDWTRERLIQWKNMRKTKRIRECASAFNTTNASVSYALSRACKRFGI